MSEPVDSGKAPAPKKSRWRRWGVRVAVVSLVLLIGGELFARYYLGLGDPPLLQTDPEIEYLFKPDQNCKRFGNHIRYNHYSMRNDDFPVHKSQANEFRVLVVGDSVVNGGVLTDQANTVTAIMQRKLGEDLKRPVIVGNISAGSWGPPNELAFLKRFGLFDADVVVIVLSSHDFADAPTFEPIVGVNAAWPDHKPFSALWEGFERYVLPRFKHQSASDEAFMTPPTKISESDVEWCSKSLHEMIAMGRKNGAKVLVAQHLEQDEKLTTPQRGHDVIALECLKDDVKPIELGVAFEAAQRRGENPYRDHIHPNDTGQRIIATSLLEAIEATLPKAASRPTTAGSGR